jgi:hypothetical protein
VDEFDDAPWGVDRVRGVPAVRSPGGEEVELRQPVVKDQREHTDPVHGKSAFAGFSEARSTDPLRVRSMRACQLAGPARRGEVHERWSSDAAFLIQIAKTLALERSVAGSTGFSIQGRVTGSCLRPDFPQPPAASATWPAASATHPTSRGLNWAVHWAAASWVQPSRPSGSFMTACCCRSSSQPGGSPALRTGSASRVYSSQAAGSRQVGRITCGSRHRFPLPHRNAPP